MEGLLTTNINILSSTAPLASPQACRHISFVMSFPRVPGSSCSSVSLWCSLYHLPGNAVINSSQPVSIYFCSVALALFLRHFCCTVLCWLLYINTLARVVLRAGKFEHITSALIQLHWLPVKQRALYKLASITFNVLQPYVLTRSSNYS